MNNNKNSSLFGNEAVYPAKAPKSQCFKNLPQNILELQNDLWSKVKSGRLSINNKASEKKIYTVSAVVGGVAIVIIGVSLINKRKKNKEEDLSDLYE